MIHLNRKSSEYSTKNWGLYTILACCLNGCGGEGGDTSDDTTTASGYSVTLSGKTVVEEGQKIEIDAQLRGFSDNATYHWEIANKDSASTYSLTNQTTDIVIEDPYSPSPTLFAPTPIESDKEVTIISTVTDGKYTSQDELTISIKAVNYLDKVNGRINYSDRIKTNAPLGSAYDSSLAVLVGTNQCVTGDIYTSRTPEWEVKNVSTLDYAELYKRYEVDLGLSFKPLFDASANAVIEIEKSRTQTGFALEVNYIGFEETLMNPKLKQKYIDLSYDSPSQFVVECGDSYLGSKRSGGSLVIAFQFNAKSAAIRSDFESDAGLNIPFLDETFSMTGALDVALNEYSEEIDVIISAKMIGGSGTELAKIFGVTGSAIKTCSGSDEKQVCTSIVADLYNLIGTGELFEAIEARPSTLSTQTYSYHSIKGEHYASNIGKSFFADAEVDKRNKLDDLFYDATAQSLYAKRYSTDWQTKTDRQLYSEHNARFERLQTVTQARLDEIEVTRERCYTHPATCMMEINELNELLKTNEAYLLGDMSWPFLVKDELAYTRGLAQQQCIPPSKASIRSTGLSNELQTSMENTFIMFNKINPDGSIDKYDYYYDCERQIVINNASQLPSGIVWAHSPAGHRQTGLILYFERGNGKYAQLEAKGHEVLYREWDDELKSLVGLTKSTGIVGWRPNNARTIEFHAPRGSWLSGYGLSRYKRFPGHNKEFVIYGTTY